MAPEHDWYRILKVAPDAPDELIKRSFTILAKLGHPDAGGSDVDMDLLQKAKGVLLDPIKRRQFDEELARQEPPRPDGSGGSGGSGGSSAESPTDEPWHDPEPAPDEVIDDWGTEEIWSPPPPPSPQPNAPPPNAPPPNAPPPYGPPAGAPWPPSAPYPTPPLWAPAVQRIPVPRRRGLPRQDIVGRTPWARVSGAIWVAVTVIYSGAALIADSSVSGGIFLLIAALVSLLIARQRIIGSRTWPYVGWVAMALLVAVTSGNSGGVSGVVGAASVLLWAVAYVVATETRRRMFA